ncbi:protein-ADP-ribose hydrolase [Breznakiella homolactica]|uniref:Protein-ADP-ribose hydrolase n=1 Tax=Breznakiella homolactica TaxID=2798577 RepID=A0A7T7XJX4_9SPIR|nr:protein-ADP-ribose hydrolase [Breznakiella homolactica]QQO07675.1 protein-ADP-ribose hydrolase [Breznakiella homolactica]
MNQDQRLDYLVQTLLNEREDAGDITVPKDYGGKRKLLRALVNVRPPAPADEEFLKVQDEFLQIENTDRGIVDVMALPAVTADSRISLWRGDICRLKTGAIVNAANSQMLGCFIPGHNCIDNAIHTAAGIQLREACYRLMEAQGHEEPTGNAKVTPGFNLPAKHVIHTVGPIVQGGLTERHERDLASCYTACLNAAAENAITDLAFCCISTGVFGFPQKRAAEIAVSTVLEYLENNSAITKVVFNVFTDEDYALYRDLLSVSRAGREE